MDEETPDYDLLAGTIVPNKILAEIGTVAVYYSYLDNTLDRAIWALLGLNEDRGRIVTVNAGSFASRVDLFKSLAQQKYTETGQRERMTALATHLRFAGDDRNRLMHDDIFGSMGNEEDVSISVGRTHPVTQVFAAHNFDRPTMRDLQSRLRRLQEILGDGREGWLNAPLPSLDKSPTLLLRRENEERQRQDKRQPPQ